MDTESIKQLADDINNVVIAAVKPYQEEAAKLRGQLWGLVKVTEKLLEGGAVGRDASDEAEELLKKIKGVKKPETEGERRIWG